MSPQRGLIFCSLICSFKKIKYINMEKIVFLGPKGATFSYRAYEKFSETHSIPKFDDRESELISVSSNKDVLTTMVIHSGSYGVLAVETTAQGRVTESVEQFIELLSEKSVSILGAIEMRINFALMTKPGIKQSTLKGILGHQKAFGACVKNSKLISDNLEEVESNGKAAEMIANNEEYFHCAAIAPAYAAQKFGLEILTYNFEDEEAWTTFFILGPVGAEIKTMDENRALIVFTIKDEKGSLVMALNFLKDINLIHIHSVSLGGREYGFVIEIEVSKEEIPLFQEAIYIFKKYVARCTIFGPFGIEK